MNICKFTCEGLTENILTDEQHPTFHFCVEAEDESDALKSAYLLFNGVRLSFDEYNTAIYQGAPLREKNSYEAKLFIEDNKGNIKERSLNVETGLMLKTLPSFITDGSYSFKEKKISPEVLIFKKRVEKKKRIKRAYVYATALGVYDFLLNGEKVGDRYLAPGFTSYKSHLQYQRYDITTLLKDQNDLHFVVAGGWAVGSFVFTRANRVSADRQALFAQIDIEYEDGTRERICTDENWSVARRGPYLSADLYDGQTYDARISLDDLNYRRASFEKLRVSPSLKAEYGSPILPHEKMSAELIRADKTLIYDFKQNFAGVVHLKIKKAKAGQKITVRHAEILNPDGSLNTSFLRSAKATLTYICREGDQEFSPTLTYMGFRYAEIDGIDPENIDLTAYALYSDLLQSGNFRCSDEKINKLFSNILWSAKSNFMDIPTDCPQRDERMGWTGDISVFSPTALCCFEMDRFLKKWLIDMKAEQKKSGGIPNTIPVQGYGFPTTMPVMAVDFWGDAALTIPYNMYMKSGDKKILETMYPVMKKYVDACLFWAHLFSIGKNRYIWKSLYLLHFGDWISPDIDKMSAWQKRSKYTATASLKLTSDLLSKVAKILGYTEDEKKYEDISKKTAEAYEWKFFDKDGKLKGKEFQTGYVLPIAFEMLSEEKRKKAADHLAELVQRDNYRIQTGFPGTPYILFALADNGHEKEAFEMLFNRECPSWLYEVEVGGTTIWERWDGLDKNGNCPIGDDGTGGMISYNHYASGAVGAFFFKRICGVEPLLPGYKEFRVKPLINDRLNEASCCIDSAFGRIEASWKKIDGKIEYRVSVPYGTSCHLIAPDGKEEIFSHGVHNVIIG